ncbi:MAG: MBL fold metallo-hydrolase, partial [Myxococcales bacterium]|nr:MBL fold metallo-hydrolase [Myxococcales bacterium]
MADLLALSSRFIDEDLYEGAFSVNRVNLQLSEVGAGVAMIEAFSHVVAFDTGEGLVLFDTSLEPFAPAIKTALRGWRDGPLHTIAFTHGHVDHVGGAECFVAEARERGDAPVTVIGHESLPARFDRYALTNGYNAIINRRQFHALGGGLLGEGSDGKWGPAVWVRPTTLVEESHVHRVGELTFEIHHDRGETDDHLWAWVPERQALVVGDFVTWVFPNAGNPQKVQRYPREWAQALREMMTYEAELLLPAHGLPVAGKARVAQVLGDIATVLESLVEQTLALMNEGA